MKLSPLLSLILVLMPGPFLPVAVVASANGAHGPVPTWTAAANLYTLRHGNWEKTSRAEVLDPLRGVLVFHPGSTQWDGASAVMQVRHITWQGWHLVVMPATISVAMQRIASTGKGVTYAAVVHLPITLPLSYARVLFIVSRGRLHAETTKLLSVYGRQAPSAHVPNLSVHQAFAFCAKRPHLRGLPYGVDVTGYLVRDENWGGAGPVPTILLDKPRPVNWTKRPPVAAGHGIAFGSEGGPPDNRWVTLRGSLVCDRGSVMGYALGIFNG